jgi:hypothetical protein
MWVRFFAGVGLRIHIQITLEKNLSNITYVHKCFQSMEVVRSILYSHWRKAMQMRYMREVVFIEWISQSTETSTFIEKTFKM